MSSSETEKPPSSNRSRFSSTTFRLAGRRAKLPKPAASAAGIE
jgi:hypothetical protein